jgi:hypothetical protein
VLVDAALVPDSPGEGIFKMALIAMRQVRHFSWDEIARLCNFDNAGQAQAAWDYLFGQPDGHRYSVTARRIPDGTFDPTRFTDPSDPDLLETLVEQILSTRGDHDQPLLGLMTWSSLSR